MITTYEDIKNAEFTSVIANEAKANGKSKMIEAEHYFDGDTMKTLFRVFVNRHQVASTSSISMAIEEYNRH